MDDVKRVQEDKPAGHTPEVRARLKIELTNPDSGYESITECSVTADEWAVIDALLCGRGRTYIAAPDLLVALQRLVSKYGFHDDGTPKDWSEYEDARAAISRALGEQA